jgi:hypothetical protein
MFRRLQKSCASFLAILVICSLPLVRVKAQETQLQRTPGALVMGSSLAFAAAFPVVKHEPITRQNSDLPLNQADELCI